MKMLIGLVLLYSLHCFAGENTPSLQCEKKWGEVELYGKVVKRYRLRGENFPEGKRFRLVVRWYNGEEAETLMYAANKKGHLILESPEKKKDPLYALCPLKKGERIEFMMKSAEDSSVFVHTSVVPFPLEMKSSSGVKLALELKGHDGDKFALRGEGFDPGEELEVIHQLQEVQGSTLTTASSQGTIDLLVTLTLEERAGGEGVVLIKRKSEEIRFPFQGGEAALELAGACCLEIR